MGVSGQRIVKALRQLKVPSTAEEVAKQIAKTSKKHFELLLEEVTEILAAGSRLGFILSKNDYFFMKSTKKNPRKDNLQKARNRSSKTSINSYCDCSSEQFAVFDTFRTINHSEKNTKHKSRKSTTMKGKNQLFNTSKTIYNRSLSEKSIAINNSAATKRPELPHESEIKKYNCVCGASTSTRGSVPFVEIDENNSSATEKNKKNFMASRQICKRPIASDESANLAKKLKLTSEQNEETPVVCAQKRSRSFNGQSVISNNDCPVSSHELEPFVTHKLDETLIRMKMHEIFEQLAVFKKHIGTATMGSSKQTNLAEDRVESVEENERNEILLENKILKLINELVSSLHQPKSNSLNIMDIKKTVHDLIDEYMNAKNINVDTMCNTN